MTDSWANLDSFAEFLVSDSGIVSVVSLAATVALGVVALVIAYKYQALNETAAADKHNELVEHVVALATLLGGSNSEQLAESIARAHIPNGSEADASSRHPAGPVAPRWRSGAVLAADVTADGTLDLVTQNRDADRTTLRLFKVDDRLRPSLRATLETDPSHRFVVESGHPVRLLTTSAKGAPIAYVWKDGDFRQTDSGSWSDQLSKLTRWPSPQEDPPTHAS